MSFWRTFGFHTVSAVETILDRESFSLEELLDEEEILQELKSQNKKLLEFLVQPQTLLKLFTYITDEAPEDADPKRKFKYPFLACEILCAEIWTLTEAIFQDETLLDVLFSYLYKGPPLNPLLASYTSRVAIVLLSRRTSEVLAYVKRKENIIAQFICHLGSASMMELLLKIIGTEESAEGAGVVQWLCTTELVPSLLGKFDPSLDEDIHENVGQTLSDIINISSRVPDSALMGQLESEQFVSQMFQYIFSGSNSVLLNGLGVVIEMLKHHAQEHDATDDATPVESLPPLLSTSVQYLPQFNTFLKTPYSTSLPTKQPAVGFYRLKVISFLLALLRTRYQCVDDAIVKLGILNTILDIFFSYYWNNFLHATVEQIILTILEGRNDDLKVVLLADSMLLDRIVEANHLNIAESEKAGSTRLGHMGFLTTISLAIANAAATNPKLEPIVRAHADWMNYVDTSLTEIRTIENKPLGGHRPVGLPMGTESSGDDDEDQQDPSSVLDRYKFGFSEDFPEDANDEYDDGEMSFDHAAFGGAYNDKNFELYNDEQNEGDVGSDDSDEDRESELWIEKKIADVGHSPTEDSLFPNHLNHNNNGNQNDSEDSSGDDEEIGDFVSADPIDPIDHLSDHTDSHLVENGATDVRSA